MDSLTLHSGASFSQKALLFRAFELEPTRAGVCSALADLLPPGECLSGRRYRSASGHATAQHDVDEASSARDTEMGNRSLRTRTTNTANAAVWNAYSLRKRAVELEPTCGSFYAGLGALVGQSDTVALSPAHPDEQQGVMTVLSNNWTKRDLLIEALRLAPSEREHYCAVAEVINDEDELRIGLERKETKRSLLIHAIGLAPTRADAYTNLASLLSGHEHVLLQDGTKWTRRQLHMAALGLEPSRAIYHSNAAAIALGIIDCAGSPAAAGTSDTAVESGDEASAWAAGPSARGKDTDGMPTAEVIHLMKAAILRNPLEASGYDQLGCLLGPRDCVVLADATSPPNTVSSLGGIRWQRRDLHIAAMELSPRSAAACNKLGVCLSPTERVRLCDGSVWSRRELFARAMTLDPAHVLATYNYVAALSTLAQTSDLRTARIPPSEAFDERDVSCSFHEWRDLREALRLAPDSAAACEAAASILGPMDIQLHHALSRSKSPKSVIEFNYRLLTGRAFVAVQAHRTDVFAHKLAARL